MRNDEQWLRRMLYRAMLLMFSGLLLIILVSALELVIKNT